MNTARHSAADAPHAFALRNFDAGDKIEGRYRCAGLAMRAAMRLRTQDGHVRDVVGLDGAGVAHYIRSNGGAVTSSNSSGWTLGDLIPAPTKRARLALVK